MAGPFDIDQVNIPALLGLHTQMKQQGLENMYRAQQIARQKRQDDEADARKEIMRRVFSGGGNAATAPAASEATPPAAAATIANDLDQFMPGSEPGTLASGQAAPVSAPQAPVDLIDPAELPARTDGITINQGALRELYAVDPEAAIQIQKTVYDMDKATADRITERGAAMASIAGALAELPQEQRAMALREQAPRLLALGFTPEQLNQTDLTDAGLNRYYRAGMSMEQLIAGKKDERDFGLRERQFGETARHNRASEGISGGNLALARQRESRVTKWGPQAIVIGGGARSDTSDLDY